MTIETAEQPGLFPEPARIETKPTEPRWTVFESDLDDLDDDADDTEDQTLFAVDTGDDLEALRDSYDDFDTWLTDNLIGKLYGPYDWPEDDSVDHAVLHVINTLGANGYLAALAAYQRSLTLSPAEAS